MRAGGKKRQWRRGSTTVRRRGVEKKNEVEDGGRERRRRCHFAKLYFTVFFNVAAAETELQRLFVPTCPAQPRYPAVACVVGELRAVPKSPHPLTTTNLSPLDVTANASGRGRARP